MYLDAVFMITTLFELTGSDSRIIITFNDSIYPDPVAKSELQVILS